MSQILDEPVALTLPRAPALQGRFWDETSQLLGLFDRFREANDHANAMPCFGRLAAYRFDEISRRPSYDPSKISIISVFQPKSGGTYLHNRLLQLGYQELWWLFSHRLCLSVCYASDEALQYYMRGGCTCHTHARPDANIRAALDRAGVERIWVHLRNPAEAVVSSYHHYLGEGHGSGAIGEQRTHESLAEAPRQGLVPGVSKSSFVMTHIGWHVEWVTQWLQFAHDHPGLVVFSYYKELRDPQALLTRVFDEFGVERPDEIADAPGPSDRFRKKSNADWRHDLADDAREYLDLRVRAELERFPAFEHLWRQPLNSEPRALG